MNRPDWSKYERVPGALRNAILLLMLLASFIILGYSDHEKVKDAVPMETFIAGQARQDDLILSNHLGLDTALIELKEIIRQGQQDQVNLACQIAASAKPVQRLPRVCSN